MSVLAADVEQDITLETLDHHPSAYFRQEYLAEWVYDQESHTTYASSRALEEGIRVPAPILSGSYSVSPTTRQIMMLRESSRALEVSTRARIDPFMHITQVVEKEVREVVAHIKKHYPRAVPVLLQAIKNDCIDGRTYGVCFHMGSHTMCDAASFQGRCILGWVATTVSYKKRKGMCATQYAEQVLSRKIPSAYVLESYIFGVRPKGHCNEQMAFVRDLLQHGE